MRLGIFAKTFDGRTPDAVLAAVSAAGFTETQYNMACSGLESMPPAIAPDEARAVAAAGTRHGLRIAAVSGTFNMIHPDVAVRAEGQRRLAVIGERCAAMSTGIVTLCTGTRDPHDQWRAHPDNDSPEAWRDLLEAMEQAIAMAERFDIELGIEPELGNVVSSAERARRLIDELQSPRIRIIFDPANLFELATLGEQRRIVSLAIELLAERIAMAHAKDRNADGTFATAGKGVLDYPHYIAELKAIGFDGALVAHGLSAAEAPGVQSFLRQQVG